MRDLAFFEGLVQAQARLRDYVFCLPAFYYDCMALSAGFVTPLKKIRALLPSPHMHPLRLTPWHGLTLIYALEYRDSDIGPYNEFILALPITLGKPAPILLGSLNAMRGDAFAYVKELPVTTEIALVGGIEGFGFPKIMATIEFTRQEGWIRCRMAEGDRYILTLSGREIPVRPTAARTRDHLISIRGDRVLRTEAITNVRQRGVSRRPSDVRLEFGNHPMAEELRGLSLGRLVEYRYEPANQLILTPALESYAAN